MSFKMVRIPHVLVIATVLEAVSTVVSARAVAQADRALPDRIEFNRDIRPILSDKCLSCHGPDESQRKADLRLDVPEGALADLGGYFAVVPGEIAKSEVWRRITAADETERMPPAESGKNLTPTDRELLRQWIEQGAEYQQHWSFIRPGRPELPEVNRTHWVRNGIDRFVLARLEREHLEPTPPADRRTLIRRVTLDLTGLPPAPEQVRTFLADDRPGAYDRLVDQLLGSPRFGERMAMEWMDAARYADTHGYHEDYHRDMWAWRDWVIDAFNANMPFDRFSIEQLAGDLLPGATSRQRIATGFNRNHGVTASGISEEYRVEYVIDRVKTTSTVWMGLTIGCAQCHDHKYDPISQSDFYRFFAYFNSISDRGVENKSGNVDPLMLVLPREEETKLAELDRHIDELEQELQSHAAETDLSVAEHRLAEVAGHDELPSRLVARFPFDETDGDEIVNAVGTGPAGRISGQPKWTSGQVGTALQLDGETQVDLGNIADFERFDEFSFGAWIKSTSDGTVLSRVDDAQEQRGFVLSLRDERVYIQLSHAKEHSSIRVVTQKRIFRDDWSHVFCTYDGSSQARGVRIYIDGRRQQTDVSRDDLTDTIRTVSPLVIGREGRGFQGIIDDVRFYGRRLTSIEVARLAGIDLVTPLLAAPDVDRTPELKNRIRRLYLDNYDAKYQLLQRKLGDVRRRAISIRERYPTVMVMNEMSSPRDTFLLRRGQYDQPGKKVLAGTPQALPPMPSGAQANRLGMARWLVDPSHPMTSRVTVNRFWQMCFGSGIVKSSEDFGTQGELPSHPRLLDWLAVEFVENGWDVKQIVKYIVTSATYRQHSKVSHQLLARDPGNRLLARGPRYRMAAELIRDNALAIAGLLIEKLGGPSVKPYQPRGLWAEMSNRGYTQDHGEKLYRRSIYTYWKRAVPPPNMLALDAPTRETCTVRRQRTNTPLMALVTLNDPTYIEAARSLAERVMVEAGSRAEDAVRLAFELAMAREPRSAEMTVMIGVFQQELSLYQKDEAAARELISVGESIPNPELDPIRLAALTCVANLILNLDEVICKE